MSTSQQPDLQQLKEAEAEEAEEGWEPLAASNMTVSPHPILNNNGDYAEDDTAIMPVDAIVAEVVQSQEAAAQSAEAVQENVAEYLAAVDDLLNENSSSHGSSSSDSLATQPVTNTTTTVTANNNDTTRPTKTSKLQLRQRLKKARQKLKESLNVQQRLVQPVARASVQTTRRVITGHRDTRVRDFVARPKVVKVLDQNIFTAAILGLLLTQYCLLERPAWFGYYNLVAMVPLLLLRVVLFHQTKQQYFLLDYCYWVNGLGFFVTLLPQLLKWFPPTHDTTTPTNIWHEGMHTLHTLLSQPETQQALWQVLFVSAHGPLFFAMIAWNNSLVFHSVDKVTSTAIHIFPALLCWCERWQVVDSPLYYQPTDPSTYTLATSCHRPWGYPLWFYAIWQITYLVQTEYWHRHKLDADPALATSLKYISAAEKMAINRATLKVCRRIRLMGPTETFAPPTLKVKFIFVFLQMIMTMVTFGPVGLFYRYRWLHTTVVIGIFAYSVSNGARYYIQVYSKIYEKRYLDRTAATTAVEDEYVDTSAVMTEHQTKKET